ncbi:hypothetical protein ES702_00053 [subsurface metagenome]
MKTQEDINKSLSDYSVLLTNKFIFIGLSLLSVPFLTRILGKAGYGQLNLFYLVANIAFIAFISWNSASILRFGKEEYVREEKLNKVFWARNILIGAGILIAIPIFLIFKERIDEYLQFNFAYIFIIIFLLVRIGWDYNKYIFQATGKLKISSLIELIPRTFFVLSILILFFLNIKNIIFILVVLIVSQLLTTIISFKWINLGWFFPVRTNKKIIKEILSFSYPLIFSSLAAYVINYVDLLVIKKYFSISDVGVYSLSYNIMRYLHQIIATIIIVTGPILIGLYTEKREDIIKTYIKRLIPQGIFGWSIILVIGIVCLPFFLPIIFGEEFNLSVLPAQILLVGLLINGIACFYSGVITTYKIIKPMVIINIIMSILNFIGDVLLVPRIGIIGAAISSAVSFSLGGVGYMYLGNKRLKLKEIKSTVFLIPVMIAFIGVHYKINLFFSLAGIIFVYFLIISKFKLFSVSDIQLLDKITMPSKLRKVIYKLYFVLGQ